MLDPFLTDRRINKNANILRFHQWDMEGIQFDPKLRTDVMYLDAYILHKQVADVPILAGRLAYLRTLNF